MTVEQALSELSALREWCIGTALPYWAHVGFNRQSGSFCERLDLAGAPVTTVPLRTMVQARQIYVYSHSAKVGWFRDVQQSAMRAAAQMIDRHWAPDGQPGWVHSIWPDGSIANAKRDTYTQAFALFGLAAAYETSRDHVFLRKAHETLTFLNDYLLSPDGLGYLTDDLEPSGLRHQNPHMHLLEACLAWYALTEDSSFIEKAHHLYSLLERHLFDECSNFIPETYDVHWKPLSPETGRYEPGHSLEWVWLLHQYSLLGGVPRQDLISRLFTKALHCLHSDGMIPNEVDSNGSPRDGGARVWPQSEALKAFAVQHEVGRSHMLENAARTAFLLRRSFLGGQFSAGWRDRLSANGSLAVSFVPASTLYHIISAATEIDRVFLAPSLSTPE